MVLSVEDLAEIEASWYPVHVVPARRIYDIQKGNRFIRPEIREWFESIGVSSKDVGFQYGLLPSRAVMWARDRKVAMMFKLRWGSE